MADGGTVDAFAVDAFAVDAFAVDAFSAAGIGADRLADVRRAAGDAADAGPDDADLTTDGDDTARPTAATAGFVELAATAGFVERSATGGFFERAATGGFACPAPLAVAMIPLPLKRPSGAAEMLVRLVSFCTAHAFCQTIIRRRIGALSGRICSA